MIRLGEIVEINANKAKVDVGTITGFLSFAYVPMKNQTPDFDYKVGDTVAVMLFGTFNSGVIVGKVME